MRSTKRWTATYHQAIVWKNSTLGGSVQPDATDPNTSWGIRSCPAQHYRRASKLSRALRTWLQAGRAVGTSVRDYWRSERLPSAVVQSGAACKADGRGACQALSVGTIEQDCDLCELHPDEAGGLSWEAYRATYGAFDLLTSPTRPFAPGAESWVEFVERIRATLERLARRFAGQTVVVVTHAGCIVASVLVLFDIPRPGTGTRLDPESTSLTEWRVVQATWRLVRFNDISHVTDGGMYDY